MARLSRSRDRIEAPGSLARFGVVGVQESANPEFASRNSHNDFVLHRQRSHRDTVPGLWVCDRHIPNGRTGLAVQCHQVSVHRSQVKPLTQDGQASIDASAAGLDHLGKISDVGPIGAAGPRVQSEGIAGRLGEIHDAIHHQGGGLDLLKCPHLEHPLQLEVPDISPIDLIEPAVAMAVVGTGIGQPVFRLLLSVQYALVSHLGQAGS